MKRSQAIVSFSLILIIASTIALALLVNTFSAEPILESQKTYGGTSGESLVQTNDGGYVIAADVAGQEPELLKTDSTGNLIWNTSIGYSAVSNLAVFSSSDGGYLAVERSNYSEVAALLTKVDGEGIVKWTVPYIVSAYPSYVNYAAQASDGGILVVGGIKNPQSATDQTWILKVSSSSNVQLNVTYSNFTASLITQTLDGSYVFAGDSGGQDPSLFRTYLAKIDGAGKVQWQMSYGNQTGYRPRALIATSDGGYMVAGAKYLPSGSAAAFAAKTDSEGKLQWTRTFGENSGFRVINQNADGYLFTGGTYNNQQQYTARIVQTDFTGGVKWQTSYNGGDNGYVYSLVPTQDGGYAFTGATGANSTNTQIWLVKVGSGGALANWPYIADVAALVVLVTVVAAVELVRRHMSKSI